MIAQYSPLLLTLAVGGVMLALGRDLGVLSRPQLPSRCGACGRLVRRGRVCACARDSS
jgi:hypothetical protein